ncbi:beta-glucosidase [Halovivax asiaticus]|uniref:beta-glucosidase n=1 Tax=Halovivax asiaticus TaxID=332953 RepID=UPI0006780273|nr:glycoside hydrolase family 3 C-terminal domain-containing protein [Halovivax asiaticus]
MTRGPATTCRLSSVLAAGLAIGALVSSTFRSGDESEPELGTDRPPADLIDEMDLGQKTALTHGHAFDRNPLDRRQTGYVEPVPELDIPPLKLTDGPHGVRRGPATAFPAGVNQISTWDCDRLYAVGNAMGREAKTMDQDVLLAPAINIVRVPTGGRTFEYFGEDPSLAARGAVATIRGIQDAGTIATAKHFVANNQEGKPRFRAGSDVPVLRSLLQRGSRFVADSQVGERALRELYLPAFRAAVEEADVGAVMTAYNSVNGDYVSENAHLFDVLENEWGFDGFTVSDWLLGVKSLNGSIEAGLDLEMPYGLFYGLPLRLGLTLGSVDEATIDGMIERTLGQMERFGILQGERVGPSGVANTAEHQRLARETAADGAVLLKNEPIGDGDPLLPIDPDRVESIAVIGDAIDTATVGGGGSSAVSPPYTVSPLAGIEARLGADVRIVTADPTNGIDRVVDVAESVECVLVFVQDAATEGVDRYDMALPGRQNEVVSAVAEANDRVAVILNTGGPVTMPWVAAVPAICELWYPGMADGLATADVVFGDVDPGGKLPITFGARFDDYPVSTPEQYPGVATTVTYTEGVFVGYRHFDAHDIDPLFPFGHGESYTTFDYGELSVSPAETALDRPISVAIPVENTGDRSGREVVQVYVAPTEPSVPRPPKELRAFEAVTLAPGERTVVELTLSSDDFAYYDDSLADWVVDPGEYTILAGSSSRDIRASHPIRIR